MAKSGAFISIPKCISDVTLVKIHQYFQDSVLTVWDARISKKHTNASGHTTWGGDIKSIPEMGNGVINSLQISLRTNPS